MSVLFCTLRAVTFVGLPVYEAIAAAYFWLMSRVHRWLYNRKLWWWPLNIPSELTDLRTGRAVLVWLCGWNGHGTVVWYNAGGYEPDMHCERCGEDLG